MAQATGTDYYEILGVPRDADEAAIKSAYRKQAMKYHPDRNPGDKQAEAKFKEAAEAYSVLSDPDKRRRYDTYGAAGLGGVAGGPQGFDPAAFADFQDILGDFFGFGDVFGRRRSGPRRGSDLRYDLELTLPEAAYGTETTLRIPRMESCATCHGSGAAAGTKPTSCPNCGGSGQVTFQQGFFTVARTCGRCRGQGRVIAQPCKDCRGEGQVQAERTLQIKIPAGVDNGSQLRISGEGEGGTRGGPSGDLYVVVRVQEHPFFRRDGQSLHCEVPIAFTQAALGATLEVPTLDGEKAKVEIPAGSQPGDTVRVKGHGVPHLGQRGKGDLHVSLRIVVPTHLSAEQKKLVEQLAKTLPIPQTSEADRERSILDRLKDWLG
ncbi:MAG: molecular chaperone DnaJ [Vicinamibacteria bacterium]|nr:molecular chaperone DnaJ [Vicinamibacteria bacterium]